MRGKRTAWSIGLLTILHLSAVPFLFAAEIVIYGFEESTEGWVIPDWAKTSPDHVAKGLTVSRLYAEEGQSSLEVEVDFPGGRWTAAYVEREVDVTDWTPFGRLSVSVYVPANAPSGLQGRVILTVGDLWQWTEMNRPVSLRPGSWTTIAVNLRPGSMDWKFFPEESFRENVRKLGLRVESDREPAYSGSVFLDHVRLAE